MDLRATQLLKLLGGQHQFIIPIYQRTYSWTRDQCQQLWADIFAAASSGSQPYLCYWSRPTPSFVGHPPQRNES